MFIGRMDDMIAPLEKMNSKSEASRAVPLSSLILLLHFADYITHDGKVDWSLRNLGSASLTEAVPNSL